ncbi:MAG: YraN family protein [Clostridia bacterium]|nr:YraN family protein [Oscillospiraceae bacterium]MBR6763406.1 YraN family protein [Clostridia bacterium]
MERKLLGRWGEELAASAYKKKGYKLLDANYHSRFGEIDLILGKGKLVVFSEVKLRKSARFAAAREFVTRDKQEKIMKTALLWLADRKPMPEVRFDVVEIYAPLGMESPKNDIKLEIYENAFWLTGE